MIEDHRPPLVRLTWRPVLVFVILDVVLTVAIVAGIVMVARGAPPPNESTAIRVVLDGQVAAWNRGDLEGFMAGYWKDERLSFYSGDSVTKGWQATLDRYRKRYQAEGKEMGQLKFQDVHVEVLGDECALARGRWHLTMKDGKTPNGLFTLLLRKIGGQWRVVHDHTSSGT